MLEQNDWLQTELDALTSSQEDSPVRTSPSQAPEQVCPVSAAACGPSFSELSLKFDPVGQSLRMSLGLELSELTECSLTWQEQVTPLGRWWWVLSMPGLRTDGNGFGLLPTPRTTDIQAGRGAAQINGKWYRPSHWLDSGQMIGGANLADVALMLPTPKASDGRPKGNGGDRKSPGLEQMAKGGMLPTPNTTDYKGANTRSPGKERPESDDDLPTRLKRSGTGPTRLSPCFVEWMMGFPAHHTDVSD